jgi:hypothetical protein
MYSTTAYLYQQINRVLLIDTSGDYFTMRYDPVYSKQLTVNKGVDNVLLFEFINQDEKPVNITGSGFVFRLMSQNGDRLLLEKVMTVLAPVVGRVKVVLSIQDTINFVAQPASYSIQRTSGNYVQAAYVSADSQARCDCNIVDSILPEFVPSAELTIPTIYGKEQNLQPGPAYWPDWALQPQPQNTTQLTEFYSSFIDTSEQSTTTIKMDLDHFTGTVKFQAAEDYQSVWYDVTDSYEFFNRTAAEYFNVVGYHPLLRAAFNNQYGWGAQGTLNVTDGVVTSITVSSGGSGYLAPPKVQILGNGAGCVAEAVIANGVVTNINVIDGGSGYTPVQYQSTNFGTALITPGTIANLQYR